MIKANIFFSPWERIAQDDCSWSYYFPSVRTVWHYPSVTLNRKKTWSTRGQTWGITGAGQHKCTLQSSWPPAHFLTVSDQMHCFVFCNRLRGWLDPWALHMLSECSAIELCPRLLSYHLKPTTLIPFHSECIRPSFVFLSVEVSCCQYSGTLPHNNQCVLFRNAIHMPA